MKLCAIAFALIVLDFVSGTLKALYTKTWSSTIMRQGLISKSSSVLVIALGVVLDYAQTVVDLGFTLPLSLSTAIYIILMEVGTMIENLGAIDKDIVPPVIKQFFSKLNDDN